VRTLVPDILLDAGAQLGESPRWDAARERLRWVDIDAGIVHETDVRDGATASHAVGMKVGAVAPRRAGGALLATAAGFALLDDDTGAVTPFATVEKPDDALFNDGACDAAGRMWAGTLAEDERPGAGVLYRLDPDGTAHAQVRGLTVSNGIDWSPDGRTMYFVDSATPAIDRFDFDPDTGTVANRRTFVALPAGAGDPDGIAVDDEGGVWVALWDGSAVHRYAPGGEHTHTVALPTTHVTACAFRGSTLYITTAAAYVASPQPHAGALFAVDAGVTGPPARPFAG
jgi:sugar lactone lactonase YvrE